MKYIIALLILVSPLAVAQMQGSATFDLSDGATEYTLYNVDSEGTSFVLAEGASSPLSFTMPDGTTHAAFYMTAGNLAGESDPTNIIYWNAPTEDIDLVIPPQTPVNIHITVN